MLFAVVLVAACQPIVTSVDSEHVTVSASEQSPASTQSDTKGPILEKLEQGFSTPQEGLLDYEGMMDAIKCAMETLEVTISSLPVQVNWNRPAGLYFTHIWDGSAYELYYVIVKADTGEMVGFFHEPKMVRDSDSVGLSEKRLESLLDKEKAIHVALEYCDKLYKGKKVVAYETGDLKPLLDEADSGVFDFWVTFEDNLSVGIGIQIPGYNLWGIDLQGEPDGRFYPEDFVSQRLVERFSAPQEGFLDYDGMKKVLEGYIEVIGVNITGLPLYTYLADGDRMSAVYYEADHYRGHFYYYVYIGADSSDVDHQSCFAILQPKTGDLLLFEHSMQQVRDFNNTDFSEERIERILDKKKAMQTALEYCEKLYDGKTVVAYYTDAVQAMFDKDDSILFDCYILFDNDLAICMGIKVPGYTLDLIRPEYDFSTKESLEQSAIYRPEDPWMDNRN